MAHWWRAYDEAVDDPKLQTLPPAVAWGWFNLMCLCSANGGVLPATEHVAFKLRLSVAKAETLIETLQERGLFEQTESGIQPHNWNARQFKSDVSTDRVKQFRKRKGNVTRNVTRNVSSTVSETPPDTDTDTDTESSLRSDSARAARGAKATRLPINWRPDREYAAERGLSEAEIDREAEKFRNFWVAKSGKDATKLDWDATWRNWVLNAIERRGGRGPPSFRPGNTFLDVARELSEPRYDHGLDDTDLELPGLVSPSH